MVEKSRGPEKFASSKEDLFSKYPPGKLDFIVDSNSHLKIEEIDEILTDIRDNFAYGRSDIYEDIDKFLYANRDFDLKKLYDWALADPLLFARMPSGEMAQPSEYLMERLYPEYAGTMRGFDESIGADTKAGISEDVYSSLVATPSVETPEARLEEELHRVRYDISRLLKYYRIFEKNSGDYYQDFLSKHPEFEKNLVSALEIAETLSSENVELSDEEIAKKIRQYNEYVSYINSALGFSKKESKSREQSILEDIAAGKIEVSEENLTEEEKQALLEFAEELRKQVFPDSYLDRAVMGITGQKKLDAYQKYLLALGNGAEMALTNVVMLADPETYKAILMSNPLSSAYDTLSTLWSMSEEDWVALYRSCEFMARQLDTHSTVANAISFIVAVSVLRGGFGQLSKQMKSLGSGKAVAKIISKAYAPLGVKLALQTPESVAMMAPLAVMWGIGLPYLTAE